MSLRTTQVSHAHTSCTTSTGRKERSRVTWSHHHASARKRQCKRAISARRDIGKSCQKTGKRSRVKFKDCLRENQTYAIKLAFWQILPKHGFSSFFLQCTPREKTAGVIGEYSRRSTKTSNRATIKYRSSLTLRNLESLVRRLIFYAI